MKVNNVYVGNNIEVLKTFPDKSIDSVVTDPPYGINFMNKKWDYDVPNVELWQEVFRVLKPGGHMLVACGTRTQHRMAVNIEDAGFEIRDIVAWVYGSGFPKSMDISKALDKYLGSEREVIGKVKGAGSVGKNKSGNQTFVAKNKYEDGSYDLTKPSTEQAKQWQGWGTALKPSMELWTLARKPLKGTVAQNILEYGVGGINIDGCRVATDEILQPSTSTKMKYGGNSFNESSTMNDPNWVQNQNGRFPANFIHDGSDEVEALFPETEPSKSGFRGLQHSGRHGGIADLGGNIVDGTNTIRGHNDNGGSASRFFYVAKASQEERNFGLYDFEDKQMYKDTREGNSFDVFVKRDENGKPLNKKRKNIHPTVKPIELMRYLVRMITPPNGICLDPYLGSGTTAIACEMEKFNYIGIELDEQYVEIAKARVGAVKDYETSLDTKTIIKESIKEDKEKELGIMNIFDLLGE